MYEMVLKMQTVQRHLIKKTETAIAKEVQLRDLERTNNELRKQLLRCPGPDFAERLNCCRDAVKAKARQIKVVSFVFSPLLLLKSGMIYRYLPPLKYLHRRLLQTSPQNTLFYLSIIFSHLATPPPVPLI